MSLIPLPSHSSFVFFIFSSPNFKRFSKRFFGLISSVIFFRLTGNSAACKEDHHSLPSLTTGKLKPQCTLIPAPSNNATELVAVVPAEILALEGRISFLMLNPLLSTSSPSPSSSS
ncbi:hypothetical protein IHE45_08G046900 [Dioscorea alata]|uniref:Uncharacterized protein n=1 Tax=Dioscorea alata TaxID=55571 RepID=A0ACB7VIY8_DIOAL|nr:hypothetical protein IHE45_08G046900 [Dioscorea alata]